jgi:hypothetical protein
MDRRVVGLVAALGLIGAVATGTALAQQNDNPTPLAPDTSSAPDTTTPQSGTGDETNPQPSTPDEGVPETPPPQELAVPPQLRPTPRPTTGATAQPPAQGTAGQTSLPPGQTLLPPEAMETPAAPSGPPPVPANAVLLMTGLDKITGKPTQIAAQLNVPVKFATFTITARYCYSTPPSETPETSAFVQIDDHRPDQPEHRIFSGWMYASSPGLNGVEHPLYDVWVISCKTNAPGQAAAAHVASHAAARVGSPDATDNEGVTQLPEGSGQ